MKILLDTHALLWFVSNHPNLSPTAAQIISDPANQKIVSVVSLWEITIKVSLRCSENLVTRNHSPFLTADALCGTAW